MSFSIFSFPIDQSYILERKQSQYFNDELEPSLLSEHDLQLLERLTQSRKTSNIDLLFTKRKESKYIKERLTSHVNDKWRSQINILKTEMDNKIVSIKEKEDSKKVKLSDFLKNKSQQQKFPSIQNNKKDEVEKKVDFIENFNKFTKYSEAVCL